MILKRNKIILYIIPKLKQLSVHLHSTFNNQHLILTRMFQINLIAIMAMGRVYEYMAERLTVWGELSSSDIYQFRRQMAKHNS